MTQSMTREELIFGKAPYAEAAKAISDGDAATLRRLIESGLDVNFEARSTATPWGQDTVTLLLWAVLADSPQGAALVLEAGADPNKATRTGMTPLIMASGVTEDIFLDMLLEHKADPNRISTAPGRTALLVALAEPTLGEKRWRRAEKLVKHGANVNLDIGGGQTALIDLSQREIWDAVLWLLEHGANVEARNKAGMTMPCHLRNSFKANALQPSEAYVNRERVRDWLLEHGMARSRVDPSLHQGWDCDD